MKGRVIVLGTTDGREVAALMVDGTLQDLLIAPPDGTPGFAPGAILRGTVDRQMKGIGGVFIRLPDGARGFLRDVGGLAPGHRRCACAGAADPGRGGGDAHAHGQGR